MMTDVSSEHRLLSRSKGERFILRSPVASALRADYPESTFSRILGTLVTEIKVFSS